MTVLGISGKTFVSDERQSLGGTSAVSACGMADKREIPEDQGTSAARSEI
jgi:hypothetical protein